MSGYLRRLASNVMNPGRAIHPVVGLFSGASYEARKLALEEEMVVAAPKPEDEPGSAPEAARLHPSVHHREEFFVSPPEPLVAEQKPGAPEVSAVRRELPAEPEVRSARREPALLKASPEDIHQAQPILERADSRTLASEPVRAMAMTPEVLTAEKIRHRDNFETVPFEKSNPLRRAPLQKRAAAGAAAKAPQLGEIQIHIGRIEVTAAPPPAARPQPKAAPKSPSLAEYLQRGRGR
ncbi:MAG TPA: hypothetical protein VH639_08755 [Bryobacteraceae bacterium]|jgi:hypothetical protein